MTNSEFNDIPDVFNVAARNLSPQGLAGPAFIERVLQPFCQARAGRTVRCAPVCLARCSWGWPAL